MNRLRGARPRRRRRAQGGCSHPANFEPSLAVFVTPSSVHESPAPPSPRSLMTEPVAVSVSAPPPPCGRKRGRERCQGRVDAGHT